MLMLKISVIPNCLRSSSRMIFRIWMGIALWGLSSGLVWDSTQFSQTQHWTGIGACVKMQIAANGEVFCSLKDGILRKFPSINTNGVDYVDVWSNDVGLTAFWNDRGMLGMAVDPNYPANPYIWVLVSVTRTDNPLDQTIYPNSCDAGDGGSVQPEAQCDQAARLIRIKMNGNSGVTDLVLMTGWCSNGMSHHLGNLAWARDGGLYVSGGDGSSYTVDDRGTPGKPCHRDADARFQGAWRSQWDDYTHGKILYISKTQLMSTTQLRLADVRIVAKGLRNPFRFAIHPVTYDLYIGDVGSDFFEEINRLPDPLTATTVPNFGWPCFEGVAYQPRYGADAGCADVAKIATKPFLYYSRTRGFNIPGAQEHCMRGSVSPAAFTFRSGTDWGSAWQNRMIWADSSMQCIFALANDAQGAPDPDASKMVLVSYNTPTGTGSKWVDFTMAGTGADSALYAVDYDQSQIHQFKYLGDRTVDPNAVVVKPGATTKGGSSKSAASNFSFLLTISGTLLTTLTLIFIANL